MVSLVVKGYLSFLFVSLRLEFLKAVQCNCN